MAHDSSTNAPSTEPTSDSAAKPTSKLTESEFLQQQATDAKAAISRVVEDLKQDLAKGADPRGWVQVAPWTTLGVAAVAGFLAASAAIPSKEDQALKRLRKIEKAIRPDDHRNGHSHDSDAPAGGKSLVGQALGQMLHAIQPIVMSALTAGLATKGQSDQSNDASQAQSSNPGL